MLIANPIYDSVFKYMMTNLDITKGVISTILDEEIVTLDFKPQEHLSKVKIPKGKEFMYYDLDFITKIKLKNGEYQNTLINVEKSHLPYDIPRFRKFLGDLFVEEEEVPITNNNTPENSLPIVNLYFLGVDLPDALPKVIKVNRQYIDVLTGKEIHERSEFIEKLTHDSFVIQIQHLHVEMKTKLEEVLSVFQQENFIDKKGHMKSYKHKTKNPLVKKMLRELEKAAADEDVLQQLELEEMAIHEYESTFTHLERRLATTEKKLELKEQVIEQKNQIIQQTQLELEKKAREMEQKEKLIKELLEKINQSDLPT